MVCQTVRLALLVGAITAVAVSPARADAPANCCGPTTRTIQTWECVPETYTVKRTAYKVVCVPKEVETCSWVCTPEVRERVCNVVKKIPVTETQIKKCYKTVMVNEERTVMKTCYKTVQETVMQKHLVSLGHWECREVQPLFGGLLHHNDCDPCNKSSCNTCNSCPRTRKVWVCCPKYECCPKTVCKKVCVQVPTKVCVPCCKKICTETPVQVCTFKCVTEKHVEKYTVNVRKQVMTKQTIQVRTCVPYEETVTCTRMVRKCVTREVPCDSCGSRFGGFFHRSNGCCCR